MATPFTTKLKPISSVPQVGTQQATQPDPQDVDVTSDDSHEKDQLARKLRSSPEIIQDYRNLANDPQYQTQVPSSTRESLKKALDKAEQLYDQKTNRNDWLEVAQTVGNALSQFGAANSGAGPINPGPGINYQARNERAGQEYGRAVAKEKDLNQADRQQFEDKYKYNKDQFGNQESVLKTELSVADKAEADKRARDLAQIKADQQDKADAARDNRTDKQLRTQENIARNRDDASIKREEMRQRLREQNEERKNSKTSDIQSKKERDAELKDIQAQEKSLSNQLNQAIGISNDLISSPDVSKKNREKVRSKLGERSGKAGVDLTAAQDYLESEDAPRTGGGIFSSGKIDASKAKPVVEEKLGITNMRAALDELKARKKALMDQKSVAPVSGTTTSTSTVSKKSTTKPVAPAGNVKVNYKGQVLEIPQADVAAAVKDGAVVIK